MAAALEHAAITPDTTFDCENGSFRVPGSVIHDSHPHGVLSATEILQVSSNIGAAKIAFALGPRAHFEMLQRFGFGEVTGIGFPGESAGLLRPWRQWRPLDHATIAFGQGVGVTPIQLAAATAALANGGRWVRPRLVAARRAARGAWQPTPVETVRQVVRPETATAVLAMMEGVVGPDGTARHAALRDVRVAGKTGTAQKFDPETGTYSDDRFRGLVRRRRPGRGPEAGDRRRRRRAAAPGTHRRARRRRRSSPGWQPPSSPDSASSPSRNPALPATLPRQNLPRSSPPPRTDETAATTSAAAPRATSARPAPRVTRSNPDATEASRKASVSRVRLRRCS